MVVKLVIPLKHISLKKIKKNMIYYFLHMQDKYVNDILIRGTRFSFIQLGDFVSNKLFGIKLMLCFVHVYSQP